MTTKRRLAHDAPAGVRAFLCAAVAAAALLATSCGRASAPAGAGPERTAPAGVSAAIARHFEETVAPGYGGDWEYCIPVVRIVATDATDPADIRAWGAFEVWNYRLDGGTLLCVSGGSHPGLAHLRETGGTLAVVSFEPVLDGADNLPSAKRIFGRHFAAWRELEADDAARGEARRRSVAEYVAAHAIPAGSFQDYGWDPVPIPPAPGP
jgi:hypothetical protein